MWEHRQTVGFKLTFSLNNVIRLVPHCRKNAGKFQSGVNAPHIAYLLHDVCHTPETECINLDGDDHLVRCYQSSCRCRIKRRRAVDYNPIIVRQPLLHFAYHAGVSGRLFDLSEVKIHQTVISREKVDIPVSAFLDTSGRIFAAFGAIVAQDIAQSTEMHFVALQEVCGIALAVSVYDQHALGKMCGKDRRHVYCGRRLGDAALQVAYGYSSQFFGPPDSQNLKHSFIVVLLCTVNTTRNHRCARFISAIRPVTVIGMPGGAGSYSINPAGLNVTLSPIFMRSPPIRTAAALYCCL